MGCLRIPECNAFNGMALGTWVMSVLRHFEDLWRCQDPLNEGTLRGMFVKKESEEVACAGLWM